MIDRTVRHGTAWCSLAAVTVLLVTGCSVLGGSSSSAPTTSAASDPSGGASTPSAPALPATSAPATSPQATGSTVPDPGSSATAAPGSSATAALASRDFTADAQFTSDAQVRNRFAIVELKRRGELLDLTATVTNLETDRSRDLRWPVAARFAGPRREDITEYDGAFSGAVLTDVAGKKRYLVAADSGHRCVCTVNLVGIFPGAGQTVELSATYAAPPTTTTKLDVTVASLGTFRDLPIT